MPVRRGEALVRDCDLGHTHILRRSGHNSTIASISTEHHLSSQKVCILYLFDCHSRLSSPCCWALALTRAHCLCRRAGVRCACAVPVVLPFAIARFERLAALLRRDQRTHGMAASSVQPSLSPSKKVKARALPPSLHPSLCRFYLWALLMVLP